MNDIQKVLKLDDEGWEPVTQDDLRRNRGREIEERIDFLNKALIAGYTLGTLSVSFFSAGILFGWFV